MSLDIESTPFFQKDYFEIASTKENPFSETDDNSSRLLLPSTHAVHFNSSSEELSIHLAIARKTIQYVQTAVPHSSNFPMRSKQGQPDDVYKRSKFVYDNLLNEPSFDSFVTNSVLIKKYKAGNCKEMATVGLVFIVNAYSVSVFWNYIEGGNHAFIQIGEKNAVFCDPWSSSYYPKNMMMKYLLNYEGIIKIDNCCYPLVRKIDPNLHQVKGWFGVEFPRTLFNLGNTLYVLSKQALKKRDLAKSILWTNQLLEKIEYLQPEESLDSEAASLCLRLGLIHDSMDLESSEALQWYAKAVQRESVTASCFLSSTYTKICERAPSHGIQLASSPFYKLAVWYSRFGASEGDLRCAHQLATLISMDPQASEENRKLEVLALRQIVGSSQGRTQDDIDAVSVQQLHRKANRKIDTLSF